MASLMDEETRAAFQAVSRATRANAAALTNLRETQLTESGRLAEVLRRVEAQLARIEAPPTPENPRVAAARVELAVDQITLMRRALGAPTTIGRWLAADRVRTGALLVAVAGALAQLADGAPLIATLGRALLAWGSTSAGGATP
jgi:hypothetical protein